MTRLMRIECERECDWVCVCLCVSVGVIRS